MRCIRQRITGTCRTSFLQLRCIVSVNAQMIDWVRAVIGTYVYFYFTLKNFERFHCLWASWLCRYYAKLLLKKLSFGAAPPVKANVNFINFSSDYGMYSNYQKFDAYQGTLMHTISSFLYLQSNVRGKHIPARFWAWRAEIVRLSAFLG